MLTTDRVFGKGVRKALPLVAAVLGLSLLGGCGCQSKEESEPSEIARRAKDEAYQKALSAHRDIQKGIMGEVEAARKAYEAAVAGGTDAANETAAKAKSALDAAMSKLEADRREVAALVGAQLRKDAADGKNISKQQKGK